MALQSIVFIGIMVIGLFGAVYRFLPGIKPDNEVEELIEFVIEDQLGCDIDLSPDTDDPDDKKYDVLKEDDTLE